MSFVGDNALFGLVFAKMSYYGQSNPSNTCSWALFNQCDQNEVNRHNKSKVLLRVQVKIRCLTALVMGKTTRIQTKNGIKDSNVGHFLPIRTARNKTNFSRSKRNPYSLHIGSQRKFTDWQEIEKNHKNVSSSTIWVESKYQAHGLIQYEYKKSR